MAVQDQPGQTVHETPISKITRAKWTEGVVQVHLLCKLEALSSNPSPTHPPQKKKSYADTWLEKKKVF
jgi:hypothetical protein